MKHCLITGGAGFIGSHLAESLLARGDRVSIIDDESTGRIENLAGILDDPHLNYTKGSVGNEALLEAHLDDVDEVYHLAAAVGVQLIASSPIHTLENNIYPTEMLLRQLDKRHARGQAVKLFLASTSEVYGKNPKPRWTEEDDLVFGPTVRPRWSYGVSKAVDEFLALAYCEERGLPVVIARFFNVVGPRQTGAYGMVLPRFIDAALDGGPLMVHDDGLQVRCFAHVLDVVEAVQALMQTPQAVGQVFNLGSDQPTTILALAKMVTEAVDPGLEIRFQTYAEAYNANFEDCRCRVPDLSKLHATIDARAKNGLADVVREVVAYKRKQRAAGEPR